MCRHTPFETEKSAPNPFINSRFWFHFFSKINVFQFHNQIILKDFEHFDKYIRAREQMQGTFI